MSGPKSRLPERPEGPALHALASLDGAAPAGEPPRKVTRGTLGAMKNRREPILMVTCYDATFARIVDASDVHAVLVGDSLGMVVQGHATTLPVTMEDVLYHVKAVARGLRRCHLVADLPFLSYQVSDDEAIRNAGRMLQDGGAEAVKLEGGVGVAPLVQRMVRTGIPVMGHIGLTPQSIHQLGGYRVQGKTREAAESLVRDAVALEAAGAYAIVLEGIPGELAKRITATVSCPTIGIGAGPACDGQVLVLYDLLGLDPSFHPKFVKRYEDFHGRAIAALNTFGQEVRGRTFPGREHTVEVPAVAEGRRDGALRSAGASGGSGSS